MEKIDCEVLIVGAGVIGLAVAERLSRQKENIILLETHPQFGQETSSRNSEVIHSGIYYPLASKKTEWCIEGRKKLYAFCEKHAVQHAKVGKYVVATNAEELSYLETLSQHCHELRVPHQWVEKSEIEQNEPLVVAHRGLHFPETGIIDSHEYMAALERLFLNRGGMVAYRHQLLNLQKSRDWIAEVKSQEDTLQIQAPIVINAAGLFAAEISKEGLNTDKYAHRFCRGRYFVLSGAYRNKFRHLIYPVPQRDGLGVHVTIDQEGQARLGPDVDWASDHRANQAQHLYDCDWAELAPPFVQAVQRYCPSISTESLSPGLIGIRTKLFIDGQAHRDFWVENHDGFVHCLGIESPGLTSSLAIAEYVSQML